VQTELVRRWGPVAGILAATTLYTFGPLHWRYSESEPPRAAAMFASTFAIGLFFGALYRRSGNLWIVGILHAIGNAYIVSTVGSTR
jgi:membrane protease YdiL (CAAX protease family)